MTRKKLHITFNSYVNEQKEAQGAVDGKNSDQSGHPKTYTIQDGIGSSKYTVSWHDGVSTNSDGSPMSDIRIFKNKRLRDKFVSQLTETGYKEKSW